MEREGNMEESYGLQDYSVAGERVQTVDPVCGTVVTEEGGRWRTGYAGETFYFCSKDCQVKFEEDPGLYIGQRD